MESEGASQWMCQCLYAFSSVPWSAASDTWREKEAKGLYTGGCVRLELRSLKKQLTTFAWFGLVCEGSAGKFSVSVDLIHSACRLTNSLTETSINECLDKYLQISHPNKNVFWVKLKKMIFILHTGCCVLLI